jgi:hypothetical protein
MPAAAHLDADRLQPVELLDRRALAGLGDADDRPLMDERASRCASGDPGADHDGSFAVEAAAHPRPPRAMKSA